MKRRKYPSLRNDLGITQQDLAMYLKVSRTLVDMEEKGTREYPTTAMVKYSQLGRAMDHLPPSPKLDEYSSKERSTLLNGLQLRSRHCQAKANGLKVKLADMQALCQQTYTTILTIHNLRENMIPVEHMSSIQNMKWIGSGDRRT